MHAPAKFFLLAAALLVAGPSDMRETERRASVMQTSRADASKQGACKTDALLEAPPTNAIACVLALPTSERLAAATTLLASLADRPDEAVRVAQQLCRDDSVLVREHGDTLITVLSAAGEHARAVAFAARGGPERGEWLARAFRQWSARAPEAAAEAALALLTDDAAPAAFGPWAARDPVAMARFGRQSPAAHAAARDALMALLDAAGETNESDVR